MRILMLTQTYSPIVGGEERVVEDLSAELVSRGHDVAVATLRQPAGESVAPETGVRVHTLRSSTHRIPGIHRDTARRHAPPGPDPESVLDLRAVLREEQPDVVHAHNWLIHSYLPLHRRRPLPLLMSLHDYGMLCATKRLLYRDQPCSGPGPVKCMLCAERHYGAKGLAVAAGTMALEPTLHRHVDVFLPVSPTVRDLCRIEPDEHHRVIPNFIEPPPALADPGDLRLRRLPDEPFVLFCGDVTEDKGARHLVEAYVTLNDPPPLVMIGRPYLDDLAEHPGVSMLGSWPHNLLIEAMRRSLFSVAPSIWPEPFGLVALETAAVGRPAIASKIGGLKDIVAHEESGILVPPGDQPALRGALQRLIGDAGLRERMGRAGAARATLFSPEAVIPRFEEAYELARELRKRQVAPSPHKAYADRLVEVTIPSFQDVSPSEAVDVDDPRIAPFIARLPDEPFILFVGAFRKVKGLETVFDAYRRLSSPPPLVLLGTYERDSPEHFPPEAIVLNDVPHAAVMAAWDRAMFGVMPSLWPEPFGATVAEAMNRGKPVIGTRLGGHTDMIDSDTGILIAQGDVDALAQAMEELIADPELRDTYGRAARARAETFTAASVLPRFEQSYRDVIAAGNIDHAR